MTSSLSKLAEGLGIVPNNTIIDKEVDLNNLNNNPFNGTFKQVYDLVLEGKMVSLTRDGQVIGVDVKAPEGYTDSEANYYYDKAYGYVKGTYYPLLAMQLFTANLIPQEIVNDGTSNLKVRVLNNTWLDMYGDETTPPEPVETSQGESDEVDEIRVDASYIDEEAEDTWKQIKHYLRKEYGRCLARDYEPTFYYDDETDEYVVRNLRWGRKLSKSELDNLTA